MKRRINWAETILKTPFFILCLPVYLIGAIAYWLLIMVGIIDDFVGDYPVKEWE